MFGPLCIKMRLRAARPEYRVQLPSGAETSLVSTASRPILGFTQPPIQQILETRKPGRAAEHSLPSDDEVKMCGAIPPLPIRLHGAVLH
jgi:hypothetical protein